MKLSGKTKLFCTAILILTILLCYGCDLEIAEPDNSPGNLIVKITDAPFPIDQIAEANVVINRIEIKKSGKKERDPYLTVSEEITSLNLINLRNGITETLPGLDIPTGLYDLVKLYVEDASIVLTDGREFDLDVPNGAKKGIQIKIKPELYVEQGLTAELLLDIDLSKSFKVEGKKDNITGFKFKPKIRAVNNSATGRFSGYVRDADLNPLHNAEVWVEKDSVVSNTFSDADGKFALIGLPVEKYKAYATKSGYDTVSVKKVDIVSGNETIRNFVLTPQ